MRYHAIVAVFVWTFTFVVALFAICVLFVAFGYALRVPFIRTVTTRLVARVSLQLRLFTVGYAHRADYVLFNAHTVAFALAHYVALAFWLRYPDVWFVGCWLYGVPLNYGYELLPFWLVYFVVALVANTDFVVGLRTFTHGLHTCPSAIYTFAVVGYLVTLRTHTGRCVPHVGITRTLRFTQLRFATGRLIWLRDSLRLLYVAPGLPDFGSGYIHTVALRIYAPRWTTCQLCGSGYLPRLRTRLRYTRFLPSCTHVTVDFTRTPLRFTFHFVRWFHAHTLPRTGYAQFTALFAVAPRS